jgi:hypothetical protein
MDDADEADLFRRRTGRAHPRNGDGSLLCLLLLCPRETARTCGTDYLEALQAVLDGIALWRQGRARGFSDGEWGLSVPECAEIREARHGISETQHRRA